MPYRISQDGLCVRKKAGARWKTVKCHGTHRQALAHLRALEANVQEIRQWLQEAGGSLDDKVARVRSAFHKWYNEGLSWERMAWVLDVFEDHVMVNFGQKVFRVDYTIDAEENVSFASTPWPVYALRYVPAAEGETAEAAAGESGDTSEALNEAPEAVHEAVKLTVHLAEAAKDDAGLFPGSTIVVEGLSANHNEYTQAALESGVEIFEGAKLVADHELEEGEAARPEGSIHDVIGKVTNVRLGERDGRSVLLGDVFISESETKIRTKVKEGILGDLSIRAWGAGTRAKDGHFVVESFQPHPYTNIAMVTVGAAGGRLVSESRQEPATVEDSTVDSAEHQPESDAEPVTEAPRREVRALRESESAELTEVVAERDQLLQENTRLFRELRETQAERQIAEAVSGAGDLPQATLARIAERTGALKDAFATHGSQQTVEQFREAVDALVESERAYLAQIVPNGAVTGLTQPGGGEPVEDILAEAFKDIVPPEQVAVAIRGRG